MEDITKKRILIGSGVVAITVIVCICVLLFKILRDPYTEVHKALAEGKPEQAIEILAPILVERDDKKGWELYNEAISLRMKLILGGNS